MKKGLVVYFTTSGNTQMLAESIAEGLTEAGVETVLKNVSDATVEDVELADVIALGSPAQGTEELDDSEFEPYYQSIEEKLAGKKVALFGSYGWGGGAFMDTWAARVKDAKAELVADGLTVLETPDQEALDQAKTLGTTLANA